MVMRQRLSTVTIYLLILALLLQAVSLRAQENPQDSHHCDGSLPIVRFAQFNVYDPAYIGVEMGFFEGRGICLDFIGDSLAGPTAIQAISSGRADAGNSSIPALINAVSAGLPVIGVSDFQSAIDEQPLEHFYVRADSDIQTIADLEGRTIAVNLWRSSFHYTILAAFDENGLAEDSAEFVLLGFGNQADALAAGEVDMIGLIDPFATAALAAYPDTFRELFNAQDVFGNRQFALHFVNSVWAEYNPALAIAFAAGLHDSIAWIAENQDEAREIVAAYIGLDVSVIPDYYYQPDGGVVIEDIEWWLAYMRDRGDVTAEWVTADMVGTNRLNPVLGNP